MEKLCLGLFLTQNTRQASADISCALPGRLAGRVTLCVHVKQCCSYLQMGARGAWGTRTTSLTRRPRFAWWAHHSTISLLPLTERKAEPVITAWCGQLPSPFISTKLRATLPFGAKAWGRVQFQRSRRDHQAPEKLRASDIWESDGCKFIDMTFF